jgi:hypothetical protein
MGSAPQKRQDAGADQLEACERRPPLRRPELDAVCTRVPQFDDARRILSLRANGDEVAQNASTCA